MKNNAATNTTRSDSFVTAAPSGAGVGESDVTLRPAGAPRFCENPCCGSYSYRPEHMRKPLVWSGNGRPPRFCSKACKMADYRARKAIEAAAEIKAAGERARADHERRRSHEHERIEAQVRGIIAMELARIPNNSRVSTTQRVALAASITRALMLADVVDTSSVDRVW